MTEEELGELNPEDFESLMLDFVEREAATDDISLTMSSSFMLAEIASRRVVEVIDLGRVFASRIFAEADFC
jgi:hypothetical protein